MRIVIADDHPLFRRGLREVIEGADDLEVICEAGDGEAALSCLRACKPDVAILDIDMPGLGGLDVAAAVMLQGLTTHYLTTSTYPVGEGTTALVHAAAGGVGQLLVQTVKGLGGTVVAPAGGGLRVPAVADEQRAAGQARVGDELVYVGLCGHCCGAFADIR